MKNTVIFDLDGTLLNTLDDLTDAVNHALEQYRFPPRSPQEIRNYLGHGFAWLVDNALPDGTATDSRAAVFEAFHAQYMAHCFDRTRPYDGIPELLTELLEHGCNVAVVSNKGDEAVKQLIARYFPGKAAVVVGEREGVRKKPAPDTVFEALRALGANADDAVYVGDSEVDAETAKNAGLPCVLVSWGFRDRALLDTLDARAVIDCPAELLPILQRL